MPGEDIITRSDLDMHCEHLHKPIEDNFADVKGWLSKLDARMWALMAGVLIIVITSMVNMFFAWGAKSELREQRPRSAYESCIEGAEQ